MSLDDQEFAQCYRISPSMLQNWREKISAIKDRHPSIFFPYTRLTRPRLRWGVTAPLAENDPPFGAVQVDRQTEIAIEAYPRSANTFATAAFHMAQKRKTRIAYHMHSSAQIFRAAKLGIPILSIIRNPDDAVASTIIYIPKISVISGYRLYFEFYEALWPYREKMVMASFEEVTADFGQVIDKVNTKFSTQFQRFAHTEENVKRCWAMADEAIKRDFGDELPEEKAQRPSEQRKGAKQYLMGLLHSPEAASYRDRSYRIYRQFIEFIQAPAPAVQIADKRLDQPKPLGM